MSLEPSLHDAMLGAVPQLRAFAMKLCEVDPGFGTRRLIGKPAAPLLNGADHDETNETQD